MSSLTFTTFHELRSVKVFDIALTCPIAALSAFLPTPFNNDCQLYLKWGKEQFYLNKHWNS